MCNFMFLQHEVIPTRQVFKFQSINLQTPYLYGQSFKKGFQHLRPILAKSSNQPLTFYQCSSKQKTVLQFCLHPQIGRCVCQQTLKGLRKLLILHPGCTNEHRFPHFKNSQNSAFGHNLNLWIITFEISNFHEQNHFITKAYDSMQILVNFGNGGTSINRCPLDAMNWIMLNLVMVYWHIRCLWMQTDLWGGLWLWRKMIKTKKPVRTFG